MPERVAFLLGKDPATSHGGDMTMFRAMRTIVAEHYDTEVICLSEQPHDDDPDVVRIAKPPISKPLLLAQSLVRRRSLVHTRFDVTEMRDAIERSTADRFVAEHSYMAEPYLRADGVSPHRDLFVSTDVSEAAVWRQARRPGVWVEARRLRRDEFRVASAARAVAGYDRDEMDALRAVGLDAHWLPLTLPPADPVEVATTPPRLVLLGNRTWLPNAEAVDHIVRLWPQIAAGVPDAELWLVGPRSSSSGARHLPAGVTDLGFVNDVDVVLAECRALVAPVTIGPGVRVKLLEAAARGLPVVATPAAIGSIEASVGVTAAADEADFVAQCRGYLLDPDHAAEAGSRLYSANARQWTERVPHDAVLEWLDR
jgi:glycosyltransferase involved in cell wall biosynthesis